MTLTNCPNCGADISGPECLKCGLILAKYHAKVQREQEIEGILRIKRENKARAKRIFKNIAICMPLLIISFIIVYQLPNFTKYFSNKSIVVPRVSANENPKIDTITSPSWSTPKQPKVQIDLTEACNYLSDEGFKPTWAKCTSNDPPCSCTTYPIFIGSGGLVYSVSGHKESVDFFILLLQISNKLNEKESLKIMVKTFNHIYRKIFKCDIADFIELSIINSQIGSNPVFIFLDRHVIRLKREDLNENGYKYSVVLSLVEMEENIQWPSGCSSTTNKY